VVTRRDVARRAGTSEAVVSYVLNDGPRNVSPATRERVLVAIHELGYRANAVARSLRTNRTTSIGLVVPDASNSFFGLLAREIENVAFSEGYTLLIGNAMENEEREAAYVRTLLARQVDGLIIAPLHGPDLWRHELTESRVRSVILDREVDDVDGIHVTVDNEGGAYNATNHLLRHGRSRIACVAGPAGVHSTDDRVAGWRRALIETGLDAECFPVSYGYFRQRDGYHAGRRMLSHKLSVDAVFVTSDEQAIGLLRAAAEVGVRVPDDLAIFGFDGLEGGAFSVPAISTVEQPLGELARIAVERILRRADRLEALDQRIRLPTRLLPRESCGCSYRIEQ
jgi:LacI family transcriptional regulator